MAYGATRRSLASFITRTLTSSSSSCSLSSRSRFVVSLVHKSSLSQLAPDTVKIPTLFKISKLGYSTQSDQSPNENKQPPKEPITVEGCDFEHWLIIMEFQNEPKPSQDTMVDTYVKTLASVLGSEEEAKKKIYSVSTVTYTGFGALISEELARKVKGMPGVIWVLPDSYMDVHNKDYGGDLFVDGKVISRPQYHYNTSHSSPEPTSPRLSRKNRKRGEKKQAEKKEQMKGGQPVQQPPSTHASGGDSASS